MKMAYKVFGSFVVVISVIFSIFYYQTFIILSEKSTKTIEESAEVSKKELIRIIDNNKSSLEKEAIIFSLSKDIVEGIEKNNSVDVISEAINNKKIELYKDPTVRNGIKTLIYSDSGANIYFDDLAFKEQHIKNINYEFVKTREKGYTSDLIRSGEQIFICASAKIFLNNNKWYKIFLLMPLNDNYLERVDQTIGINIGIKSKTGILTTIKNSKFESITFAETGIVDKNEKIINGKIYYISFLKLLNDSGENLENIYILKNITENVNIKNKQMRELLVLIGILFILSGSTLFIIISIMFNKFNLISVFFEKLISKDYGFKISQEVIKQKDEVGILYSNIEKIKSELQSNDEKIRHYSKELEISYKEMKNYTYIVEVKNKELVERLKEQELVKEILNRGIKELSEINRFLKFLLKKIYEYKKYKRAELIYKNSIDNAYERVSYIPEKDKFIDNFYEENLKYLINERPVTKDDYMEIPIKRDKEIIGNLKIEGIELSGTTEKTIEIIANELEIILENAELYYKMDKKIIELSFLNSISVALSSITDINELKNMINDSIGVLFGLSNYDIYVYEKGYFLDFKELNGDIVKIKQKKVEDESIYILNKFGNIKIKKEYYIPLVIKEKLIGAIRVDDIENFKSVDKNIVRIFLTQLSIILQNNLMYFENRKRSFDIIKSLAQAIEEKDQYTRGHSQRVMTYSVKLAEKLKFTSDEIEQIRYAGILHDIGKIGISENILLKNGKLTDEEYEIVKQHPEKGYKIMSHISSLHEISKIVKYHHERPDGKGYPEGLKGEAIPKAAKIMSLADTFDAMTSDRPYRKGLDLEIAKEELKKYKGFQFDEDITNVFLEMLDHGEIKIEK